MAIIVTTANSSKLLADIKLAIDKGTVATWTYDSDGDFTHSADQWKHRAWLRPTISSEGIVFKILTPKETTMTGVVYGIFHGRFIEMLLTHFDLSFSQVVATALPSRGDIIKS